jgi:hypothetical protein
MDDDGLITVSSAHPVAAGIDLPLKALAREDHDGRVWRPSESVSAASTLSADGPCADVGGKRARC